MLKLCAHSTHAPATPNPSQRGEDEWQPAGYGEHAGAHAAAGTGGGRAAAAAPRRNVVRINLRQQTAKPNYAEQSDDEGEAAAPPQQRYQLTAAGNPALAAFQGAPAAAAPAAVPAPADIAAAWQQPAAVPDWAAHLPPAPLQPAQQQHYGQPQQEQYSAPPAPMPQSFQPAQPPWLRKVASASGMGGGTASKASSGSAAGAVAKPAPYRSTTPGFYAGAGGLGCGRCSAAKCLGTLVGCGSGGSGCACLTGPYVMLKAARAG